jgi:hypothetical protein
MSGVALGRLGVYAVGHRPACVRIAHSRTVRTHCMFNRPAERGAAVTTRSSAVQLQSHAHDVGDEDDDKAGSGSSLAHVYRAALECSTVMWVLRIGLLVQSAGDCCTCSCCASSSRVSRWSCCRTPAAHVRDMIMIASPGCILYLAQQRRPCEPRGATRSGCLHLIVIRRCATALSCTPISMLPLGVKVLQG